MVWSGELDSLKRFKDDVKGSEGYYECGFSLQELQRNPGRRRLEIYEIVSRAYAVTR